MFKKLKEKTAELKDRAKKKVSDATEQSRRFRESMESITGVDKARERFAHARILLAAAVLLLDSAHFPELPRHHHR